ncbi:UNVERIFIED_CONTAM: hypothetical protein Sradi_1944100 [Sesamum radiatum]|uniref:Uncharacterized protein n=1 Tax=Sesamum radiatum TaxID=300843 RepID=A0AAW2TDX5_SESRA
MATSDESLTLEFIRHHLLEDFTSSSAADSFFDNLTTLCFSDVYADKPIWSPGELESPSSSGPTPQPDSPISQYFAFSPDLFEFETKPQISMSTTTDIQDDPSLKSRTRIHRVGYWVGCDCVGGGKALQGS